MRSRRVTIFKSDGQRTQDWVACEEPLEVLVRQRADAGYVSLTITMRTPGDDFDLVRGFLLSEGVIERPEDLDRMDHAGDLSPNTGMHNQVAVDLAPGHGLKLERLTRHFMATSSCGICGRATLDALEEIGCQPLSDSGFEIKARALLGLPARLAAGQVGFEETGGQHGAAAFTCEGEVSEIAEDIGRHNALDKLLGRLLVRQPNPPVGILVSSRASFELVQKAIRISSPVLASVGAPSSLAIEAAQHFGVTLVGFLRDNRFNIYSHPGRIVR